MVYYVIVCCVSSMLTSMMYPRLRLWLGSEIITDTKQDIILLGDGTTHVKQVNV